MSRHMYSPFRRLIDAFREKGATTPEKAMTWKELGLPEAFEKMSFPIHPDKSPIVQKGNKYYLSEDRLEIIMDEFGQVIDPLRKWIQHTAKVPKGFLRYRVLHKLEEQSMSGAELTTSISEDMGGRWKPKPGSIYPLLKSLLRDGLTREIPDDDGRTRRYELTESGHKFLKDHVEQSGELLEKIDQSFTPFLQPFFPLFNLRSEKRQPIRDLFEAIQDLRVLAGDEPSPELLDDFSQAIDRFTKDIKRIAEKFKDSKQVS